MTPWAAWPFGILERRSIGKRSGGSSRKSIRSITVFWRAASRGRAAFTLPTGIRMSRSSRARPSSTSLVARNETIDRWNFPLVLVARPWPL